MITDAIVSSLLAVIDGVLSLLPAWSPPALAGTTGFGIVEAFSAVFPVASLVLAIVAILALELLLQTWDLAVWVYHQVWGSD